jgi:hypothetical protein
VLTDNGIQFSNRKRDQYASCHIFDRMCHEYGIDHRLTKTNHPWTSTSVWCDIPSISQCWYPSGCIASA